MIFLGIGANLTAPGFDTPLATCEAAVARLRALDVRVIAVSPWYESAPVPVSDQPWYVNAVLSVETDLAPAALLALLHEVEASFGRVRGELNAARSLDLDILDFDGLVTTSGDSPRLPHPRMHERAFVLLPLRDLAAEWTHPVSGANLSDLIAKLPTGQDIRRVDGENV